MDPVWLGPYTISKCLGKGVYELKSSDGEILKKKANINRLKKFNRRKPEKRENQDSTQGHSPAAKKRKIDPNCSKISDGCCLTMHDKDSLLTGKSLTKINALILFMNSLNCFAHRRVAE